MIGFEPFQFETAQCAIELDQFAQLLASTPALSERRDILPFFRRCRHLSALLGSYRANLITLDRLAYELPLFGAFTADVAVGDWARKSFCLVEVEFCPSTFLCRPAHSLHQL